MIHLSASSLSRAEKCPASASLPQLASLSAAAERGRELHAEKEVTSPDGAEVAYVYDVAIGKARELGRGLARAYGPLADSEIPGTTDKVTVEADRVVIRDYKSGYGYGVEAPAKNLQLGFYAVCAADVHGKSAALVELEFLDQDSRVIAADLDAFDLAAFRERITTIHARASEPTPPVVTGDHCSMCPAIVNCPAHLTMAIAFREGAWPGVMPTDGLTVQAVADGWEYLRNAKRVLGLVEKTYRAFASQWPVPLANGKVLGPVEREREELDGPVTYQVLRDMHGEAVARAAVGMETSKTAVDAALKPIAPPRGRAAMVREALAAVEAANGVSRKKRVFVEEYQPEGEK